MKISGFTVAVEEADRYSVPGAVIHSTQPVTAEASMFASNSPAQAPSMRNSMVRIFPMIAAVVIGATSFSAPAQGQSSQTDHVLVVMDMRTGGLPHWSVRPRDRAEWEIARFESHSQEVVQRVQELVSGGNAAREADAPIRPTIFVYFLDEHDAIIKYYESDGCFVAEADDKNVRSVAPEFMNWARALSMGDAQCHE